ncbi:MULTISPECIES: helix-turn-helix domain-containing protein [Bacillus]|jgi:transcriptional regulator with XRE-family HTH domain|uniref:helix-turn-helix domain-containing protein n=1 Tax=Bacillus TaxID=1386 RepID=UPI0004A0B822|nr:MULTISPECIES: helix-turn-helix transcriptional regulator [Bacillus]MCY9192443.1 helix-turn-helix domain-containing protein [Bacillus spizizenii]KDE23234.1 XRE family transcriptional regulator [Bacillus subtilis]OEI75488.1 XRE family transcriptional regulator [Bacillus subtilis]PJH91827.1 XRE family transcriptional regulator [Bacillus sp. SN1]PLR91486.1 XRE family transcriptional regulator [Bacillus halotolerans]
MLSKRLKLIRKRRGLTQTGLASKVKTTKGTISNYENGHSTPSNEMLRDLADALDTTTDYLLGRTDIDTNVSRTVSYSESDIETDPDLQIAFREASDFSEENRKQAIDFINYLKEKEKAKGRKIPNSSDE